MAKTHLSLSHDASSRGAPTGFTLPICGDMRTMPALPKHPAAKRKVIDKLRNVVGLF